MVDLHLYILAAVRAVVVMSIVLGAVPVLIWMERKGAAYIQDRRGPNRAAILGIRLGGLVHTIADAFKLFTKTEIMGNRVMRPLFIIAPIVAMSVAVVVAAVIPFAEPVTAYGTTFTLQVADLSGGLIYVLALSSIGVYALLIGGWASCGKYPLLGALRSASQMISYELPMGLAVVALFLVTGSFRLTDIVVDQGTLPWTWNVIRQPLAFIIFIVAAFAETNRLPFDLPEGESELVAGYHTEYSSMRFAMFFMGEYAHVLVISLIIATAFFGGWQIPFVSADAMRTHIDMTVAVSSGLVGIFLIGLGILMIKRYKKRYGDLRDYEVLVLGGPSLCGGIALAIIAATFAWGPWTLLPDAAVVLVFVIQIAVVLIKAFAMASVFIWVRWTLPRFRYDQLMQLGWKTLLPLGLLNVVITAAVLLFLPFIRGG